MINLDNLEFTAPVRCYWGALDSASQRVLDNQNAVLAAIREVEPEAHVTYFPMEGEWVVHVWGRPLSGYRQTKGAALAEAYRNLFDSTSWGHNE